MTKPLKRPRDFSQAAKLVIDVATGQQEDREPTPEEQGKDPAASALGRKGGVATLTDGTVERIEGFATEGDAGRWIRNESVVWLRRQHAAMK
jgi:hypothetical protein